MSATPNSVNGWRPIGINSQLPPGSTAYAQASSQVGQGQLAFYDVSGNVALSDGSVPGLLAAGVGQAKIAGGSAIAGVDPVALWQGFGAMPFSTGAADGFTAADKGGVPAFVATENTIGRKSNVSGVNRPLAGMVYGLTDDGMAIFWGGPVAQSVARSMLAANASTAGSVAYPVDSGATVDVGSTSAATAAILMPRSKTHGVITSIEIVPSAALSATSGNDRTVTIWKIDTLGVAAAVNVGTFTTTTALVAQTAALFTLSAVAGALNMLETDILGYSTVHASSGAVIPQSAIRANMKVL